MNIENELRKKGIIPRNTDVGTQKIKCPRCQPHNHKPTDNPLALTIESTGNCVWFCHHCEYTGGFNVSTGWKAKTKINRPEKIYVPPVVPKEPCKSSKLYSYFAKRCISKETVDEMGIYAEGKNDYWYAFPYYNLNSDIVNVKYRSEDKKFKQSPNAKKCLYNYNNIHGEDTIIFVEGEIDVLSLYEIGYTNVTTLPDGAPKNANLKDDDKRFHALKNSNLKAKKVILFVDNDSAGKSLHKELLHRFGKDVCWYVERPSDCKDANDILVKHGEDRLRQVITNAVPYPVDGLYKSGDYTGAVLDLYNGNYVKPIEIGYSNLDRIYKIMKGTFHTVTGIPNHGKSYFLDMILIKLAKTHGWKFALFSPEHSTQMHLRRMVQMINEKPFDIGDENRMSTSELKSAMQFLDQHFFFIETKEEVPSIDKILEISKGAILKHGCNGVIVDPYNEVSALRSGGKREDEHIRDFISKCKRFARLHDIVFWVVAHPTKLQKMGDGGYTPPTAYDISGASHWNNQSDVILTVHRDFDDNTSEVITRKIREQDLYGKIGSAKFKFNNEKRIFEQFDTFYDDVIQPPHWS